MDVSQHPTLRSASERQQPELYRIARRELARFSGSGTIDTVALANEAYLRADAADMQWQDQAHFLASMTTVMRHVLVDYFRERGAQRRGGDWIQVTTSNVEGSDTERCPVDIIALDRGMKALGDVSERLERIVELRVFGGMSGQEIAAALDISTATVTRELRIASAFLAKALADE
jgi:RNA polymerase sigma factor (TIGR02999 family)